VRVEGESGLLDCVPGGVDDGAVDLHQEHVGLVVLGAVQEGGECLRFRRNVSWRQSPQSQFSR
jgi:hypothetical protein